MVTAEKVRQENNGVDLGSIDDSAVEVKQGQKNQNSEDLTNNPSVNANATSDETVRIYPVQLTDFDETQVYTATDSKNTSTNMNLLMNIPLELSVEIGRTKKRVKDILDMRHGTIVEFDKQANDPVEILVNGQIVAKGNVVVIDDCFGVRVTEIVSNEELFDKLT